MTSDADVIIVGSGPAGVSAAWPLVEAGIRVLMLDAEERAPPPLPAHPTLAALRTDPQRWRDELGPDGALAEGGVSPKFATPLARAVLAGFAVSNDGYMAVGSHAAGGLSRIWGALAARYGDAELAAFPDGTAPDYDRVTRRIGISGNLPIAEADPTALSPPMAQFAARYRNEPGLRLVTAPNAVLEAPHGDRSACNRCGLCLHGCSRGSIYHSALELPALRRFRNFEYRSGIRVERVSAAGGLQRVHGRSASFGAPTVVLAAGTLATTRLALVRLGLTGVPIRLESNPVGGIAFLVPRLIGSDLPDRSFGLGQLFYTLDAAPGVESAGVFYGADTLPLAPIADRLPFTRAFSLRAARALAPALLLATGYLPGRFSDNQLTVEADGAGGRLHVSGRQTDIAAELLRASFAKLGRGARRHGAWPVPGSLQLLMPGADAHPAATLPMGGTGPAATEADGALRGAPGIFVADGASLPFLSARHPTLTIIANADRIGRSLAARLAAAPSIAHAG